LNGTKSYRLHFAPGQLPPVTASGFWSVTMYGADRFLVNNAINRYSIGDRTPGLTRNPDGSLDLIMSHARPTGSITNWLRRQPDPSNCCCGSTPPLRLPPTAPGRRR